MLTLFRRKWSWFIHHAAKLPPLSDQERRLVEYLTGSIPLLLRPLFDHEQFDETRFVGHEDLSRVKADVIDFFFDKQSELSGQSFKQDR
jgi:hypothetical protein